MFSLNDFLAYKTNCPLCFSTLKSSYVIKEATKTTVKLLSNEEITLFAEYEGWKMSPKHTKYGVLYLINRETNVMTAQYFDKDNKRLSSIPKEIQEKQKNSPFPYYLSLKKYCSCHKYFYQSSVLKMIDNIEKLWIKDIDEKFYFIDTIEQNFYQLYSLSKNKDTILNLIQFDDNDLKKTMSKPFWAENIIANIKASFNLPNFDFSLPEKVMIERLKTLILFS